MKTSIDNTTGERSLFLNSNFFSTRLALYFSTQNSKFRLVFFFSFVNIYFANLDSYFLLHSMYFTSFDLRIMFSTCFYYRYNFVRNGTPYKARCCCCCIYSAILVLLHPSSGYSEIHFYFEIHSEIAEICVSGIINR